VQKCITATLVLICNILLFSVFIIPLNANDIITRSSSVLLLDCVNFREYSFEGPSDLLSLYNRPLTFLADTAEQQSYSNNSKRTFIDVTADLSSETGEPLFLRLTGGDSRNREHGTFGKIQLKFSKIDAQISGIYRHLGMYADRTEQFCSSYGSFRKSPLHYRDMGHYGVAEYIIGQLNFRTNNSRSKTVINKYGEWVAIPGLYNPVYKLGNAISQTLNLKAFSGWFAFSGMADERKLALDHLNSSKKLFYNLRSSYKRNIFIDDTFQINALISNEKKGGSRFGLQYEHSKNNYNLSLSTGVWSAAHPDVTCEFSVPFLDSCKASVEYGLVYVPEEKSIIQVVPQEIVETKISDFQYNRIKLYSSFRRFLKSPFSFNLGAVYKSSYQSYFIDTIEGVKSTRFAGSGKASFTASGSLRFSLPVKSLLCETWSNGQLNLKGRPFEYVPYEFGINFLHCFKGLNEVRTNANLTLRGPVSWNASYYGKDSTLTSPRLFFCNFGISIPFILPILSSHITPELVINAGPICLSPSGRQRYHPFGGELGPLISATLNGSIF
jgi:hypothetical protein